MSSEKRIYLLAYKIVAAQCEQAFSYKSFYYSLDLALWITKVLRKQQQPVGVQIDIVIYVISSINHSN